MACNDCFYYSFRTDECRRNAPVSHHETGEARWPTMTHHDQYEWCGEFTRHDELVKARRIAEDPAKHGDQLPWYDTDEQRAELLKKRVGSANERIAEWESR